MVNSSSPRGRSQGELESTILSILWDSLDKGEGGLGSQEILDRIEPTGSLAVTTVLTVLSRLADKGLVVREPGNGRALIFRSSETRAEHDAASLRKIFEASDNPLLAFSHFARTLTPEQKQRLHQSIDGE